MSVKTNWIVQTVAQVLLDRATRLYERNPGENKSSRLEFYGMRWVRWVD